MKYFFITNNPELADYVYANGATRIMVDLEKLGKIERQKGLNSVISDHKIEDVKRIKQYNPNIPIICRINPVHSKTKDEIYSVIENGADYIMLPMFNTSEEVEFVSRVINGRVKLILLFETPQSVIRIKSIIQMGCFNEAHIGLNDLSIALGTEFMFEIFSSGFVEYISNEFRNNYIPFGIGGIAKYGEGVASAKLILSEHVRLGSSAVILSRSFHNNSESLDEIRSKINFRDEIEKLNQCEALFKKSDQELLELNRLKLFNQIQNFLKKK